MTINLLVIFDMSLMSFSAATFTALMIKNSPKIKITLLILNNDSQKDIKSCEEWAELALKHSEYKVIFEKVKKLFKNNTYTIKEFKGENYPYIAKDILKYARNNNINLIITPSHFQEDLKSMPVGNFSQNLICISEIPIVLVKKLPSKFLNEL